MKPPKVSYGDYEALAAHFMPGNVVFSDYWREYDLVIAYHRPDANRYWSVDVIQSDAAGNPKPGERVRNHCTWPDPKNYVVTNVAA